MKSGKGTRQSGWLAVFGRDFAQSFLVEGEAFVFAFCKELAFYSGRKSLISSGGSDFCCRQRWQEASVGGMDLKMGSQWGRRYYTGGVCLSLQRIVGAAVGFVFVDVASRLWFGWRWRAGVFLSGGSMWLRP